MHKKSIIKIINFIIQELIYLVCTVGWVEIYECKDSILSKIISTLPCHIFSLWEFIFIKLIYLMILHSHHTLSCRIIPKWKRHDVKIINWNIITFCICPKTKSYQSYFSTQNNDTFKLRMYKESRFVKGYMVLKIGGLLQTFYKILELYS